uniref:Fe2OG dioxygenase domain-containing protein n=1 Tax=Erythrolobus australicus TaxID=1077150 RepID=A0A7S1XIY3_9RHOD|mmetsp:Transcript_3529/g.9725  ORF Transcript_3529/g.9725 Transcript_3529/m.9725 type:complete len:333 (+) Transcript_3529:200-1198(+)
MAERFAEVKLNESAGRETLSALRTALETYGFFYVDPGSMFPRQLQLALLEMMRAFFSTERSAKQARIASVVRNGFTRGYIGFGAESGSWRTEVKEAFSYGFEWSDEDRRQPCEHKLQGPNCWPQESVGVDVRAMRVLCTEVYDCCIRTAQQVAKLVAECVGLPREHFDEHLVGGELISLMRLFHYVAYSDADEALIGSSPHTDWGFLTLILPSETDYSGLEVYFENEWIPVPQKPGSLIVNCGDFLSLSLNGAVQSPLHRVVLPEHGQDRYSAVFFFYPGYDAQFTASRKQGYSLFEDQRAVDAREADSRDISGHHESFGQFIARKWTQVGR